MNVLLSSFVAMGIALTGCSTTPTQTATNSQTEEHTYALKFNVDSALQNIHKQVSFGARVPGSKAHKECADWLSSELRRFGADTVIEQTGEVEVFTGKTVPYKNIIAKFNENSPQRILLAAHYDTRPWADEDPQESNREKPILGANDGGSGTGVLLEIARVLGESDVTIGVDILLVDVEDYGKSELSDSWCLGSREWSKNSGYTDENRPYLGIVLDMVGGTNARFHREYYSDRIARSKVDKVWQTAANSGFGKIFIDKTGGAIVDDHLQINNAGIPCIDIVESVNVQTKSFNPTWHTVHDNLASIDRKPLNAVGTTVLNVIENESSLLK